LWLAAALLAALLVGCGDTSSSDPGGVGEGPAYLIGTRVWDDTSTTSYFYVVSSIEDGAEIDTANALEVPGAAKIYAVPDLGWFAIGGGESPTITRYSLGEDGELARGDSISLQTYGVDSLWDTLYIVSATKAYYPDRDGRQLIVWNPKAMEVTGSIPLPETAREGYLSLYGYAPIVRGQELLISVGWFDWEESDSVLAETGLIRIDTETDTVAGFETDDRCGGITQPITVGSGDTYLVSSSLAGAAHRLGRLTTRPCALRVRSGDVSFDASYGLDLEGLTDAAVSGEPIPAGGDAIFLRVLDESLATVAEDSATWDLTGQSAWRWVRWNVLEGEVSELASLEPSTSDVLWFQVEGRVYGTETKSDYSETTLIDLTAEGGPRRALTAPGFLHGVARIR
jgi:hypothetical protein